MKFFIKYFFRTLRFILIPFVLFWEIATTPKGMIRTVAEQQLIDDKTRNLVLYQFNTCPFCIKVRREIHRLSLKIELRDAQHDPINRAALLAGGGSLQVPCLKITDTQGQSRWLYESAEINAYLHREFASHS